MQTFSIILGYEPKLDGKAVLLKITIYFRYNTRRNQDGLEVETHSWVGSIYNSGNLQKKLLGKKNHQCNFPFDYFVFKDGNVEGTMLSTTVIVA